MPNDFVYEEMEKYKADGVDFIPVARDSARQFLTSYKKEEWKEAIYSCPRTIRKYWTLNDNQEKIYIGEKE